MEHVAAVPPLLLLLLLLFSENEREKKNVSVVVVVVKVVLHKIESHHSFKASRSRFESLVSNHHETQSS